jgi:hypothetical protein
MRHEAAVLVGGVAAVVVLLLDSLFLPSVSTAVDVALVVIVMVLAVVGYLEGHLAGMTVWRLGAQTAAAGAVGLLTVALKALLHH